MKTGHYVATIVDAGLSDAAASLLTACGAIKGFPARKKIATAIKNDLIQILDQVVEESLRYFGKTSGTMASTLRQNYRVKGQTPSSIRAIIMGVDYTELFERDVTIKPRHATKLAIPLPDACNADGTPRFVGGPRVWQRHVKTYIMSGTKASKIGSGTHPTESEINPHGPEEVSYIVYKDGNGKLRFLYKLVPYSIFKEGYTNVDGAPLRKLGLEKRLTYAIASAWPGWAQLVFDILQDSYDFSNLEAYKGISVVNSYEPYSPTWSVMSGSTANLSYISSSLAGITKTAIKIMGS